MKKSDLYFVFIGLLTPVTIFLRAVAKDDVLIKGQNLSIALTWALLALAAVFWLMWGGSIRPIREMSFFALIVLTLWSYTALRESAGGSTFNYLAFTLPVVILLLSLKPPSVRQVRLLADVFFVALAAVALIGTVMSFVSYPLSDQYAPTRFMIGSFAPLGEYRWVSVFETTTQAGAVGSYLALYGFWRGGWFFRLMSVGGILIVLSASRGSTAALLAGLVVMMWLLPKIGKIKLTTAVKVAVTSIGSLALLILILTKDRTLNSRTDIWLNYFDLSTESPFLGLGTNGLQMAVQNDPTIPTGIPMMHAHNIFLDSLARIGIVGLVLVLILFIFVLLQAFRTGGTGIWISAALAVAVLVNQLSDVHIDWVYLDYDYFVLIVAFLFTLHVERVFPQSRAKLLTGQHHV